jgi:ADP-ribosylglycohydrolase
MSQLVIGRQEYRDKVYACWLGKNIGGTLGTPHEGKRYALGLDFYEPVPDKALPNDDLDLQLVWLQMMEEQGTDPALPHFADYWNRYACSYPWNEYGFFMRNYTRGLRPPVAGCFENYYVDEMGSPIRSEIWACLHAGDPQAAARMAWKDSAVDHAGGEGMYGEMFWAALQAAAFVESDPMTLIQLGLNMIPLSSHIARSIREAVWCHENKLPWGDARERVASRFGGIQPCNAVPNHGFTIIGWLYGKDFGDRLCKAVNCGYDTDCTGATLGATLGIIEGTKGIPDRWRKPVGDGIVLHAFTRGLNSPKDMIELTNRTIPLAEKAAAGSNERAFGDRTALPSDVRSRLFRNEMAIAARQQDIHSAVQLAGDQEVTFHYGSEPVLRPGIAKVVSVTVAGHGEVHADLGVPAGWTCERLGPGKFSLICSGSIADRNTVQVKLAHGKGADFTILGPGEAKGFPAGDNVKMCPKCKARVEACICNG